MCRHCEERSDNVLSSFEDEDRVRVELARYF